MLRSHPSTPRTQHFTHRFSSYNVAAAASGSPTNWWYSWDARSGNATVHFVGLSTEVYYHPELVPQLRAQHQWLQADLAAARARGVDWIIAHGHRPMYCSNVDDMPDCSTDAETLRLGVNGSAYGLEDVLAAHKVDLYLTAHEHSYERTLPVYRGQWEQQSNHTYVDPRFPVVRARMRRCAPPTSPHTLPP